MSYASTLQNSCIRRRVSMPSMYHVGWSVSSLAWVFEFLKFSFLKRKCIKLIWPKQKLICEELIHLDAYKCIIMQFVSVFITAHLYTLSSLFILLRCLEITQLHLICATKLWLALYTCSYNLGPMGQSLQPSSCCGVSLLHFFESQLLSENKINHFSVCFYCLFLLVLLHISTHILEDAA